MRRPGWRDLDPGGIVREEHFGRVLSCFAGRPPTAAAMLAAAVAEHPGREALVDGPERLDYRTLGERAGRAAAGLFAAGIRAGDRVGVWSGNRSEAVVAVAACLRLGAVGVPLGHRLQTAEAQYMLADSGARALLVEDALAGRLPGRSAIPEVRVLAAFGDGADALPRWSELEAAGGGAPEPGTGEEDLAFLLYTSGTTGRPKGAMLAHLNLVHSVIHYLRCMRLGPGERSLLAVPFTHVTGLVAQVLTMFGCAGATVVLREFRAEEAVRLLRDEAVTHAVMVPAMYNLILRTPGLPDLPRFRVGAYGGAPIPEALVADLARALPGLEPMNAYGSTETASPATVLPPADAVRRRGSVGLAVHCAEIRVCGEDGGELPPGEVGEIRIAGPMVVPGYWNLPEATREGFADGAWLSGDLGRMDEDGYLEILDRSKDMINRGGYKVFSAEVEGALAAHAGVLEAAVVARPCPVLGERVHAFVAPADPAPSGDDLRAFAAGRLADYKVPEGVTFLDGPLPRNANGKVMKGELRARLAPEPDRPPPGRAAAALSRGRGRS